MYTIKPVAAGTCLPSERSVMMNGNWDRLKTAGVDQSIENFYKGISD